VLHPGWRSGWFLEVQVDPHRQLTGETSYVCQDDSGSVEAHNVGTDTPNPLLGMRQQHPLTPRSPTTHP
jgi:hypothetical protein